VRIFAEAFVAFDPLCRESPPREFHSLLDPPIYSWEQAVSIAGQAS
jgi:hypothetical protein